MSVTYGYQHLDFDRDQIKKRSEEITSNEAIALFHAFPWIEQVSEIEGKYLTTHPSIYFYKSEKHFIHIYASNSEGLNVYYQNSDKYGQEFVNFDITKNEANNNIESLILGFFNDELTAQFSTDELEANTSNLKKFEIKIKRIEVYYPLMLGLGLSLIIIISSGVGVDFLLFKLIMFGILSIPFLIPSLLVFYLKYSYWKNDSNQTIWLNREAKSIKIINAKETREFQKQDIASFDIIRSRVRNLEGYFYCRIKAKNRTYIITHFTLQPEEILEYLNYHKYRDLEYILPSLDFEILTENEKIRLRKVLEKRKLKIRNTYSEWDSAKLKKVISSKDYEAVAKEVAKKILKERESEARFS